MPPVIAVFAIAFILASLLVMPEKKTVPPGKLEDSDDAGDLMAKALEKYMKEKKEKKQKDKKKS